MQSGIAFHADTAAPAKASSPDAREDWQASCSSFRAF
jgi:hypothetical protein